MYAILRDLANPLVVALLLTWLGLLRMAVKSPVRRRAWLWIALPLACLTLCLTPGVGVLALGSLEWQYADVADPPRADDAIVVLSGGLRVFDPLGQNYLLDDATVQRTLYGARLYHRAGRCPIVVTGGKADPADPGPPVAQAMQELLLELGVAREDILVEGRARTTHENARYSADLLKELKPRRVVLVTDAFHMMRSVGTFEREGVPVIPAPCNRQAVISGSWIEAVLPTGDGVRPVQRAGHEWLGQLWYWLRGRG